MTINKTTEPKFIGIDQNGDKIMIYSNYPRKYLIDYFGTTYIKKMYQDDKNGRRMHVGYIIDGYWYKLYKVEEFRIQS
jgi:hypothetical protein